MKKLKIAIEIVLSIILIFSALAYLLAMFLPKGKGEPSIGNFEAEDYSENWTFSYNGEESKVVTLPFRVAESKGDKVVMTKKLPEGINDNMSMMMRSSAQNVVISIDGRVVNKYESSDFPVVGENLASAYIVVPVNASDSGKEMKIEFTACNDGNGKFNAVTYGAGNNVWFGIIHTNILFMILAVLLVAFGLAILIISLVFRRKINVSTALPRIAILTMTLGLWMLSESKLRQLFMNNPTYVALYASVLVSSIAILAAIFFDDVQNHRYTKVYTIMCAVMTGQILLNVILNYAGVLNFGQTLNVSHVLSALALVTSVVILIIDLKKGYARNYKIIAIGIFITIAAGFAELVFFYFASAYIMGTFLAIGFVALLVCTLCQVILDAILTAEKGRIVAEDQKMKTIKTIANTIDAKDSYTGGHSERVGEYSRILCEALMDEYGFTQDDSNRIRYIGTLHDIGKIAVPDKVLNKQGKLTDEEYSLMKTHTSSGTEVLRFIDNINGLEDGVRHHHERYDGNGYPDGLKGEEIPLVARILCIADCYDAMTTDRVYRKRLEDDVVYEEIRNCAGTQFDPRLAEIFLRLIDEGKIRPIESVKG